MLDETKIQEAIGISSVGVSVVHGTNSGPTTIVAGIKISGRVMVDPLLFLGDEDQLGGVISRKLRDGLLHELFTILEEADAPDLQMIKSIARREGIMGVDHEVR